MIDTERQNPNDSRSVDGTMQAGLRFLAAGQAKEAERSFRQALFLRRGFAPASEALGIALERQGRDQEALESYRRAISVAPQTVVARLQLGKLLASYGKWQEAVEEFQRLVKVAPHMVEAHLVLAQGLVQLERNEEAERHLHTVLELDPSSAEARAMLAYRFQATGRFSEARPLFERAIELAPKLSVSYHGLFQGRRAAPEDVPVLERMRELAVDPSASEFDRMTILYTLGKADEDLGNLAQAATDYVRANELAKTVCLGNKPFARDSYAKEISEAIECYTASTLRSLLPLGTKDATPIFIVGMMRSGTTLVEQILTCHKDVAGGGEREFWLSEGRKLNNSRDLAAKLPDLAKRYLKTLVPIAAGRKHVTDKMPQNFQLLGTIHAALPMAPIIHVRRDPADTCFSIFTTPYQKSPDFAHDPDSIAHAYKEYLRVMDHWRTVLPQERLLEIDYEDLVLNRESVTRRILSFCGLDWDDACLSHDKNSRVVTTPSVWQVRQPMYSSSIGRWKRFESWIPEFGELSCSPRCAE